MRYEFLIGVFCLIATATNAEDLPNNLLLKCEGHVTEATNISKFDAMLRLLNGKLSDTLYTSYTVSGCIYQDVGVSGIACSERAVTETGRGYELREQKVFIARMTGEYSHYLEIRSLKTKNDVGSLQRLAQRTGVCTVSKPIF